MLIMEYEMVMLYIMNALIHLNWACITDCLLAYFVIKNCF